MSTTYSRTATLAAGAQTITLTGFGPVAGASTGVHHRNTIRIIKHAGSPAELWVALDGTVAAQNGPGLESVPGEAAESTSIRCTGSECRSRVQANGDLEISVWASEALDVTIEAD